MAKIIFVSTLVLTMLIHTQSYGYSEDNVVQKQDIVIAGLFPTSNDLPAGSIGRGVRPAVQLALDMINNDTRLLNNFQLNLTWNDTGCDMAKATKIFFDMMDKNTTKVMLFGDACSNVTGPMVQISQWWGMWQLSYADTDPKLSDRSTYSNFLRTVPSDSDYNLARLALLRRFNWTRVGTLFQDASVGSDRYGIAHNRFLNLLEKRFIDVVKVQSFRGDPKSAVNNLKEKDTRIIIGYFDHIMARKVFCNAFRTGLYGHKYQWIISGDYPEKWLDENVPELKWCTKQMLRTAVEGTLVTDVLPLFVSDLVTESGLTSAGYKQLYDRSRDKEYSKYHGYAFDGIWVIAKAMDRILQNRGNDTDLSEELFRGDTIAAALNKTNFLGVTGRIQFDGADRIGHVMLEQYRDGRLVKVGEYQRATDKLDLEEGLWQEAGGPPRDRNLVRFEMQRVSRGVYAVICIIAALGIAMATVFLIINIIFRNHRYIKMSSPNMNNMIIVGCMLSYVSIFLLGTDGGVVPVRHVKYVCAVRSWILAIGFSLSFGAMFSKTWRVHTIFTNIKLNKKIIRDYKLFIMVCVLVVIDAGILVTWQVMDPLDRDEKNLSSQVVGDYEIVPVVEYCTSRTTEIWLGILYAYKGLLLVFGCFLAWETRQVSISALNDSKYIGMSVYNVVIMCICGAAISFIIKDQPNQSFIIISLFIIFSTTITLCLVFVPKVIEIKRDPLGEERRIRATLRRKEKKKQDKGSNMKQKLKDVTDENKLYREIIQQKSEEIKMLLDRLDDDSDTYEIDLRPCLHKKVIELRVDKMSPKKHSRASSECDGDNISTYSDVSAFTTTWGTDSPKVRQRILHSTKSMTSTDTTYTETIDLVDNYRQNGNTIQLVPIKATMDDDDDLDDEYDPFGGVYLGPAEKTPRRQSDGECSSPYIPIEDDAINSYGIRTDYGTLSYKRCDEDLRLCGRSLEYDSIAAITGCDINDPSRRSTDFVNSSKPMTTSYWGHSGKRLHDYVTIHSTRKSMPKFINRKKHIKTLSNIEESD